MSVVYLNVGGTPFATTTTTLEASPFFEALLRNTPATDLFVDRDPTHFRHILNFLRGIFTYPPNIQELWYEADFYGLTQLKRVLEEMMQRNDGDRVAHLLERIHDRLKSLG